MIEVNTLDDAKAVTATETDTIYVKTTGKIYLIKDKFNLTGKAVAHGTVGYFLQETTDDLTTLLSVSKSNVTYDVAKKRMVQTELPADIADGNRDVLTLNDGKSLFLQDGDVFKMPFMLEENASIEIEGFYIYDHSVNSTHRVLSTVKSFILMPRDRNITVANGHSVLSFPESNIIMNVAAREALVFFRTDMASRDWNVVPLAGGRVRTIAEQVAPPKVFEVSQADNRDAERISVVDEHGVVTASSFALSNLELFNLIGPSAVDDPQTDIPFLQMAAEPTGIASDLSILPRSLADARYLPNPDNVPVPLGFLSANISIDEDTTTNTAVTFTIDASSVLRSTTDIRLTATGDSNQSDGTSTTTRAEIRINANTAPFNSYDRILAVFTGGERDNVINFNINQDDPSSELVWILTSIDNGSWTTSNTNINEAGFDNIRANILFFGVNGTETTVTANE